jgi:hypothetical protein
MNNHAARFEFILCIVGEALCTERFSLLKFSGEGFVTLGQTRRPATDYSLKWPVVSSLSSPDRQWRGTPGAVGG